MEHIWTCPRRVKCKVVNQDRNQLTGTNNSIMGKRQVRELRIWLQRHYSPLFRHKTLTQAIKCSKMLKLTK